LIKVVAMNVMTDDEVREFEQKHSWATGIKSDECGNLYYDSPKASCISLSYPETPLRVTYVARLISMLGTGSDEAQFNGSLLWVRLWTIGSPQLEKSGWRLVERMRMGFGELRPLGTASGHWFRSDEIADLAAFIVPCLVYQWDAYVVPANAGCFAFISHDGFWCVATRDTEAHDQIWGDLNDLGPRIDESVKRRFCRPGAPSQSPA
jgi:hypothetical protein